MNNNKVYYLYGYIISTYYNNQNQNKIQIKIIFKKYIIYICIILYFNKLLIIFIVIRNFKLKNKNFL